MSAGVRIWRDSLAGYGLISRALHWSMAGLFAWQLATSVLHWRDEESSLVKALFWSHRTVGVLILLLVFTRGVWAIANLRSRPAHAPGLLGRTAALGQLAMYVLMITVPAIALVRAYANGRGYRWLGVELLPVTGEKQAYLAAVANALHGPLGWSLYALVLGHVAMALVHHFVFRDGTFVRMTRGGAK